MTSAPVIPPWAKPGHDSVKATEIAGTGSSNLRAIHSLHIGQAPKYAQRYLPMSQRTGSRGAMRGRFISMLLLFAMLIGGIVAPESAHAESLLGGHAIEIVDADGHVDSSSNRGESLKDGVPCHPMTHHHCGIAIAADPSAGSLGHWNAKSAVKPLAVRPMASLASAPPTEPPAA